MHIYFTINDIGDIFVDICGILLEYAIIARSFELTI